MQKMADQARKEGDTATYILFTRLGEIQATLNELSTTFVSKSEQDTMRRRVRLLESVVYSAVGIILTATFGGVIYSFVEGSFL